MGLALCNTSHTSRSKPGRSCLQPHDIDSIVRTCHRLLHFAPGHGMTRSGWVGRHFDEIAAIPRCTATPLPSGHEPANLRQAARALRSGPLGQQGIHAQPECRDCCLRHRRRQLEQLCAMNWSGLARVRLDAAIAQCCVASNFVFAHHFKQGVGGFGSRFSARSSSLVAVLPRVAAASRPHRALAQWWLAGPAR